MNRQRIFGYVLFVAMLFAFCMFIYSAAKVVEDLSNPQKIGNYIGEIKKGINQIEEKK